MPIFTPGRRWQPAYSPFKKESFAKTVLENIEFAIKGPLFGCRMCGNCLLQETAFICPMECPKGLRNGPCGGSTPEYCYVDKSRPCIWYKIYERSIKLGREEMLLEVLPPLDWEKVGTETWGDVIDKVKQTGSGKVFKSIILNQGENRWKTWDLVFKSVRQPAWWMGDNQYHAPAYTEPMSNLERGFKSGEFVVACEIAPPLSVSTKKLIENINLVKPYVTAINFTDNASATPRMTSWACSKFAIDAGAEPVMQIAA
ncbi:MAG: methylenetetrahydrofolate reductase C-terminal domain-containing protein, partial [Chloroflexota bacterium]